MTPEQAHMKIGMYHGAALPVIADCLRGFIVAPPGKDLIINDYSNIEGRMVAYLAGEEWKLQAFRDADAGTGPEIYLLAASKIYGQPPSAYTDESPERQIGKVSELSMGFGGGVGAFHNMAKNYGVKVSDEKAGWIKDAWRAAHPKIKKYWRLIEDAAITAVQYPGTQVSCGPQGREIKFRVDGSFLWCKLPTGGVLCYPYPQIEHVTEPWEHDVLSYMTEDSTTKQWVRCRTWGGELTENVVQACARDCLAHAMKLADAAGWEIVMHVHDEIVCEVLEGLRSVDELGELMVRAAVELLPGFPIICKGKRVKRYEK